MYANGSNTGYADVTAACGTDYYDATEVQLFCESIQQTTAQQKRSTLFQLFGWHITSMHMVLLLVITEMLMLTFQKLPLGDNSIDARAGMKGA
jgi:hypothetical protein